MGTEVELLRDTYCYLLFYTAEYWIAIKCNYINVVMPFLVQKLSFPEICVRKRS